MKKRTAIVMLRKALVDAMNNIARNHTCDGCNTSGTEHSKAGEHEPWCPYRVALEATYRFRGDGP